MNPYALFFLCWRLDKILCVKELAQCLALSQPLMSRSVFVAVEKGPGRTEAGEMEKGGSYPLGMPAPAGRPASCASIKIGSGYSWFASNPAQSWEPLKLKVDPRVPVPSLVFRLAQSH